MKKSFLTLVCFASLTMLAACGMPPEMAKDQNTPQPITPIASPSGSNQNAVQDVGDFSLHVQPSQVLPNAQQIVQSLQFDQLIKRINQSIVLPRRNIPVTFKDCGFVNAFFDRKNGAITMCYEMLRTISAAFDGMQMTQQQRAQAFAAVTYFIFLHELGHAVIFELQLPVTGKEEDAADQFATSIFLADNAGQLAIYGAQFFYLLGQQAKAKDFFDEHSFGEQRFANVLCWVIGSNPQQYQNAIDAQVYQRLARRGCQAESTQIRKAWTQLLAPYAKR